MFGLINWDFQSIEMQEGEESTPIGGEELVGGQSASNSERAGDEHAGQPEKVYDFVHQHFGVALQSGGPESRAAEASGRRVTADKPVEAKGDSWHALKNLIRYQTSTTTASNDHRGYDESGSSFEAQWLGKNAEGDEVDAEEQPRVVRTKLNWIPTAENGPEEITPPEARIDDSVGADSIETHTLDLSSADAVEERSSIFDDLDDLLAPHFDDSSDSLTNSEDSELNPESSNSIGGPEPAAQSSESIEILEPVAESSESLEILEPVAESFDPIEKDSATESSEEEASATQAAEARSRFGSMNAFERLQKRTKQQPEPKEKQATTGDMLEPVSPDDWETKPAKGTEGATIMNEWCSTSTGTNRPVVPSLAELDSIPTPSNVSEKMPDHHKPFSINTPAAKDESAPNRMSPDAVHQTNRASWLKAASEYSSSVIKAVTDQMKSLNSKQKKVTPESPEFQSGDDSE